MRALEGLALLLLFQSAGELLSRALHLPFPGPVVGLLLLLGALRWRAVQHRVATVAGFLLAHLSLLFVPVGVGVMTHLELLQQHGLRLLVVLMVSTWVALAVTAAVLRDEAGGDEDEGANAEAGRTARGDAGDAARSDRHDLSPTSAAPANEEAR